MMLYKQRNEQQLITNSTIAISGTHTDFALSNAPWRHIMETKMQLEKGGTFYTGFRGEGDHVTQLPGFSARATQF